MYINVKCKTWNLIFRWYILILTFRTFGHWSLGCTLLLCNNIQWWLCLCLKTISDFDWQDSLFRGCDVDFLVLIMILAVLNKPADCCCLHPQTNIDKFKPRQTTLTQQLLHILRRLSHLLYVLSYVHVFKSLKESSKIKLYKQ